MHKIEGNGCVLPDFHDSCDVTMFTSVYLLQNTEEDHDDKRHLVSAMSVMTQVAAAINEFKRRKDLGQSS